jgi:hypothetical protein
MTFHAVSSDFMVFIMAAAPDIRAGRGVKAD